MTADQTARPSSAAPVDSESAPADSTVQRLTDPRILVVGAGAIGSVLAASLIAAGRSVNVLSTNRAIHEALRTGGFRLSGETALSHVPVAEADLLTELGPSSPRYDFVLLATQPPQVEEAAKGAAPYLAPGGRMVCFQNGLCEERIAPMVGRERVVGAVVAWGASMIEPGAYDRTSAGGFVVGRLDGEPDASVHGLAALLEAVGPVSVSNNLLGARWSKLAINCAISTLGTIGGTRVGVLMKRRFVRRLALEIMTETTLVANAAGVRLEKVAGTIDLDWLALQGAQRSAAGSPALATKHAVLLAAGFRYRRLRSSMLAAIERGRPPAVDFLNGEVVEHGMRHGIDCPVNRAAQERVWQIARAECRPSIETLRALYDETR